MRCTGGASESGSTTEGVVEASDAVKKLVKQLGLSTPAVLVEELLQAHVREGSAVYPISEKCLGGLDPQLLLGLGCLESVCHWSHLLT